MICCNISFAQISVERQVISSTGNLTNTSEIKASSNIGETIIPTFSQTILIVTQGFEQPDTIMTTGIEDIPMINIFIFPNPAEDFLNIEFQSNWEKEAKVEILNLPGQIILQKTFQLQQGINSFALKVDKISKGVYIVKINMGNNFITKLVVKE